MSIFLSLSIVIDVSVDSSFICVFPFKLSLHVGRSVFVSISFQLTRLFALVFPFYPFKKTRCRYGNVLLCCYLSCVLNRLTSSNSVTIMQFPVLRRLYQQHPRAQGPQRAVPEKLTKTKKIHLFNTYKLSTIHFSRHS